MFSEAVKEVLTILTQIFLRFLKSVLYTKMCASGKLVYKFDEKVSSLLPKSNRLFVKPPESKILDGVYRGQSHHKVRIVLSSLCLLVLIVGVGREAL